MGESETVDIPEDVGTAGGETETNSMSEVPAHASQSSMMMDYDDADDSSMKSFNNSSHTVKGSGSRETDHINSLEDHAQGMLETMENAKKALFTPPRTIPQASLSEKSIGEPPLHTISQAEKEPSKSETKPITKAKTEAKTSAKKRDPKTKARTPKTSGTVKKSKQAPKAVPQTKSSLFMNRLTKPKFKATKVTGNTKKQVDSRPSKAGVKTKADSRSRFFNMSKGKVSKVQVSKVPVSKRRVSKDRALEEAPKVEAETNTDATHVDTLDQGEDDESSLDFRLTKDRDGSDNDQECDSSSSTASGSNTQKTDGGILESNEKGDKIISASRSIFFSVLITSAIAIAIFAYVMFRREEDKAFEEAFASQAEEMKLYTEHNVDAAFATLKGLSVSTTSVIKRLAKETNYPPGFINIPDVAQNLGEAQSTSNALVIAYIPKILAKNYRLWEEYSTNHSSWVAEEQKFGPMDVTPEIIDYVWEYTDYKWETSRRRRRIDEFGSGLLPNDGTGLSSNDPSEKPRTNRVIERPGDCSGNEEERRRDLFEFDEGRELANDDDGPFRFKSDDNEYDDKFDPGPSAQVAAPRSDPFQTPVWQMTPVPVLDPLDPFVSIINYNLADRMVFKRAVEYMEISRKPVFLDVCDQSSWFLIDEHRDTLQTVVAYPVFDNFSANKTIVGFFTAIIPWTEFFKNNLSPSSKNLVVVMKNSCGEVFSVEVKGQNVTILGETDEHDPKFAQEVLTFPFAEKYQQAVAEELQYAEEVCKYDLYIYPTSMSSSNRPILISSAILLVFIFTFSAFMLFDCLVTRRQNKLLNTALRQNAIVNSLFPKNVQRKLMEEADATLEAAERAKNMKRRNLSTFLNDDQRSQKVDPLDSKPIADLFPHTTIMFADISGFTAWSSAREPAAVFTLLETIYRAFDEIAKRRRVFKVEVVGDCYVAVCGLPDARKDHYAVMCRFAQDCMSAMHVHTKELEVRLGPDTGDLSLRVGLHSGPVVAGVLRGDKSRFQLFGDTMNTASRMESTGTPNRIQLSQATADLLIANQKEHWITKRSDKVVAKGKGALTTYFLLSVKKKTSSTNSASTSKMEEVVLVRGGNHPKGSKMVQKRNRVADWVVEMLGKLLKEMKAKRKLTGIRPDSETIIEELENQSVGAGSSMLGMSKTVIDEVADCVQLPGLSDKGTSAKASIPAPLDKEVIDELQHYVYSIASLYRKNPFHNFEHASHVSMSCIKLLNRIASHDEDHIDCSNHHTYGICSDPLTSFGIVFSALIHDVDHCGVPNSQLVKEHSAVATVYKNKSVAEQNSIDIGWGLLMEPTYANLRRHIYTNVTEYKCFRQIVVNCIMATDIVDKDLIKARNKRWDLAFSSSAIETPFPKSDFKIERHTHEDEDIDFNTSFRKATVVIEHLIQLSDVSHTMQHWHMYRRWNERLFEESYKAYVEGRAEKNPADNWYQGELGFYDFYIIPLAKKIKQCAVFGVSSDEYLSYAVANREEWEERGKDVLQDMVNKVEAIYQAEGSRQLTAGPISGGIQLKSSRRTENTTSGRSKDSNSIDEEKESSEAENLETAHSFDDNSSCAMDVICENLNCSGGEAEVGDRDDDSRNGNSHQPKDLDAPLDANDIDELKSFHTEVVEGDDIENGRSRQPKDLEMGLDGGDTDKTSVITLSS
jgi:class 3 adenylate cyclase